MCLPKGWSGPGLMMDQCFTIPTTLYTSSVSEIVLVCRSLSRNLHYFHRLDTSLRKWGFCLFDFFIPFNFIHIYLQLRFLNVVAEHLHSALNMAEATQSNAELLEWPKKDKRRFLHVVYRVGDLDRTIKFYTECFGMKLLRKRDIPEEKYANAFLGFGPEQSHFVVELTYNYGVTSYDIGTGFGHFAIATPDVYKLVEDIRAKGGNITREPGPVKGGKSVIAFVKDPDGYAFELIQRSSTPEPLCQVMLRVGDLERSIKFYEKYTIAMLGYAEEHETTVLELTYNYGVTEYTKGNAYAQVAIGTDDVYKSAEVVNIVTQELGGKITRQPGPVPGLNTKITSFLDPDGWKTVLVDNQDFLKELE
ncbi:putative lactoylglutathione lyase [Glycine max]|nr:putative lactoylglutathione lyase [Glycine max]